MEHAVCLTTITEAHASADTWDVDAETSAWVRDMLLRKLGGPSVSQMLPIEVLEQVVTDDRHVCTEAPRPEAPRPEV